jgi:hypothetical protein
MSKECVTHHYACDCREEDFKKALAACVEYRAKLDKLERENATLREALTFYGDCQSYGLNGGNIKRILTDAGALARHALHKKEQP